MLYPMNSESTVLMSESRDNPHSPVRITNSRICVALYHAGVTGFSQSSGLSILKRLVRILRQILNKSLKTANGCSKRTN